MFVQKHPGTHPHLKYTNEPLHIMKQEVTCNLDPYFHVANLANSFTRYLNKPGWFAWASYTWFTLLDEMCNSATHHTSVWSLSIFFYDHFQIIFSLVWQAKQLCCHGHRSREGWKLCPWKQPTTFCLCAHVCTCVSVCWDMHYGCWCIVSINKTTTLILW